MTTITQQRLRGRPAHTPGPTYLAYTPDGSRLITAGSNNAIRIYTTGSDGEPVNIDDCQESNTAVVASNDFFITGSEDGTVCVYSLQTHSLDKMLVRCTLPVRDVALSPDAKWAAVASDELVVKLVSTEDMTRVHYLREQSKSVKHLSFHPSGTYLAVSCSDGILYVYSLQSDAPELVRKVDGLIRPLETDIEPSSKAVWHPDGRAFAAPTPTMDIRVMSSHDWARQRNFDHGHISDITALAWSPNGALLLSAGREGQLFLWETKTQKIVANYAYPKVMSVAWHPFQNIVSFTNSDGELFIYKDFVPSEHVTLLARPLQPAPFICDPLAEASANPRLPVTNGNHYRKRRAGSFSLDDLLDSDVVDEDEDDFVEDDDGAGYTGQVNGNGKRAMDYDDPRSWASRKRQEVHGLDSNIRVHPSFQPGSTPWRGDRRYLCLNLTGFVWTVNQDTHHTVTVEFYDREFHRDFHFTDPYLYDKACLNEHGSLFSCPPRKDDAAMIFYRPHESWTTRADWRIPLPHGESVTSMSLSDSYIVVTTSKNYVRVYTLYGTPFRVYRHKSCPIVTCASWRDYVLTMGNGPAGAGGFAQLTYTIENVKRDEVCQNEDVVALPTGHQVKTVFFSDGGDPCIYDSLGVLLVLLHWRTPGQARWVPILDTRQLDRLASGRKEESYWPVAVAAGKFHCIILKGGDRQPYFPRPLLSEFDFCMPLARPSVTEPDVDPTTTAPYLEESLVRSDVTLALQEDLVAATSASSAQRTALARRELERDKLLLQLLGMECREGEERGMKALEMVGLMRDRSGKMLDLAGKIAARYGRTVLEEKIRELAEKRLLGEDEGEE